MKQELAPLARILLYTLAGRLAAGGWLPPEAHNELLSPEMTELLGGVLVAVGAYLWYWFSQARAALKVVVKKVRR